MDDQPAELDPRARSALYALASRLFAAEVDIELYRQLVAGEPDDHPPGSPAHSFVESELRRQPEARAVEALAIEYCRLFIGPMPLCPPYASAYRGQALLGGRARQRLEEFLARHGLTVDTDAARIASPDHVAIELSVLAHIHGGTLSDDTDPRLAARELLRDHVLSWMPAYLEEVQNLAERALYRAAARLTAEALEQDRVLLGL